MNAKLQDFFHANRDRQLIMRYIKLSYKKKSEKEKEISIRKMMKRKNEPLP